MFYKYLKYVYIYIYMDTHILCNIHILTKIFTIYVYIHITYKICMYTQVYVCIHIFTHTCTLPHNCGCIFYLQPQLPKHQTFSANGILQKTQIILNWVKSTFTKVSSCYLIQDFFNWQYDYLQNFKAEGSVGRLGQLLVKIKGC